MKKMWNIKTKKRISSLGIIFRLVVVLLWYLLWLYQLFTYKQPETQLQLKKKQKIGRFWTRAKNQQIKDGVRNIERKLVVVPKDAKECL